MDSERRAEASTANGKLSKGPITEEGRKRAAASRHRHGILAQTLVLAGESLGRQLFTYRK